MVRRVRFSPDDSSSFDPRDRRDSFDDLDDLVMDTEQPVSKPDKKQSPKPPSSGSGSRSDRRNTADDRPRHLADADWIDDFDPSRDQRRAS